MARTDDIIKTGILEEPKTLNVWLATDAWSSRVLGQIYQPLYIREPVNLGLIPWLAQGDPVYDRASLSYTVKLRPSRWSDGTEFTSEDVAFTGDVIREFQVPQSYSEWKFIRKIEIIDKGRVRFYLDQPEAIFLTRTLTTPIVQKRQWAQVVAEARMTERPLIHLLNYDMRKPVGTGPFILTDWRQGAFLFLERNGDFFLKGEKVGGYTLGPHVDGMILKIFGTPDAAILALRNGSIDMFWWGIQPGYLEGLKSEGEIMIFTSEKSAFYFLGFNLRRRPFDDVHFRRAVATLVDMDFIIKRILQGYATRVSSVVPPGNAFWHLPDLSLYGEGLDREERIRRAYEILKQSGYTWEEAPVNEDGKVAKGEGLILPDGRPLETVTILTPPADYDPQRAMVGIMVQEWLKMAGIPASSRAMGFGSLVEQTKGRHLFDLFVMGYGNLSLDPDYLRNFFHSRNDVPRGWNISGYRNSRFDRIADESATTMDIAKRREIVWEMQRIIMSDIPYLPLYNPNLVEAVRADKFRGWVPMLGGIGNIWSFCHIRPNSKMPEGADQRRGGAWRGTEGE
jgi:ABC-type transport system substrate-binding protein